MTVLIFKCIQHPQILLQLAFAIPVHTYWTIFKDFISVFFHNDFKCAQTANGTSRVLSPATFFFFFFVSLLRKGLLLKGRRPLSLMCETHRKHLGCSSVKSGKICQMIGWNGYLLCQKPESPCLLTTSPFNQILVLVWEFQGGSQQPSCLRLPV